MLKTSIDDLIAELDDARLTAKGNGQSSIVCYGCCYDEQSKAVRAR
jgi:hypothetical protein